VQLCNESKLYQTSFLFPLRFPEILDFIRSSSRSRHRHSRNRLEIRLLDKEPSLLIMCKNLAKLPMGLNTHLLNFRQEFCMTSKRPPRPESTHFDQISSRDKVGLTRREWLSASLLTSQEQRKVPIWALAVS